MDASTDPGDAGNLNHGLLLDREQALEQLNNHCGEAVQAVLYVDVGDIASTVVTAHGTLRHRWSDERFDHPRVAERRDSLTGYYELGDATVDITDLRDAGMLSVGSEPPYGIAFGLAGDIWLTVTWAAVPSRRFARYRGPVRSQVGASPGSGS